MNKKFRFSDFSLLSLMFFLLLISCGRNGDGGGSTDTSTPSNLKIVANIVGKTDANPNGDGSGVVNFTVTADNATSYRILIGSESFTSSDGNFSYTFTNQGTNTYTVYVSAYKGEKFISGNIAVTVFKTPNLLWADEFETDGLPNPNKWGYDTGNNNGWGNNELEYYTNRQENASVSGRTL